MYKFLSLASLSAALVTVNVAPVFANTTNIKTANSVTVNSVALKSSLVEIEGRTLTNSEAVKVEGRVSRITIPSDIRFGICVIGVVSPCNGPEWQPKPPTTPIVGRPPSPIVRPLPMPIARPFPSR